MSTITSTSFDGTSNNALYLGGVVASSFVSAASNTANIGTAVYVVANGNVGFGNSAPANKISVNGTINVTGAVTSGDLADAVGYKGVPQNSQTGAYTLALSDIGKHISITTGGITIPANASVAFPIGATVVIFNNSGSTQTIAITTDTLRQAGSTNTGSRTLAAYGLATVVKVASTVWVVSGNIT